MNMKNKGKSANVNSREATNVNLKINIFLKSW